MKKILIILATIIILGGAGYFTYKFLIKKNEPTENINKKNEEKEKPEEEEEEEITYIVDPNSNTRPFAVMINCHYESLPQAGLQGAYIVYELMV
jgi:flagellar basal body-associated protein FliL